jgi:hypothetical protein
VIRDLATQTRAFRFAGARSAEDAGTIGDDNPDREDDEREKREAVHGVRGNGRARNRAGVAVLYSRLYASGRERARALRPDC